MSRLAGAIARDMARVLPPRGFNDPVKDSRVSGPIIRGIKTHVERIERCMSAEQDDVEFEFRLHDRGGPGECGSDRRLSGAELSGTSVGVSLHGAGEAESSARDSLRTHAAQFSLWRTDWPGAVEACQIETELILTDTDAMLSLRDFTDIPVLCVACRGPSPVMVLSPANPNCPRWDPAVPGQVNPEPIVGALGFDGRAPHAADLISRVAPAEPRGHAFWLGGNQVYVSARYRDGSAARRTDLSGEDPRVGSVGTVPADQRSGV